MGANTPVSTLSSYAYTLGAAGTRTAVTELSGRTVNYSYDDLYRLTNETIANDSHGINGSVTYGYDPVCDRMNRSSSVAGVPSQSSTYDANDRLTSDTYDQRKYKSQHGRHLRLRLREPPPHSYVIGHLWFRLRRRRQ